MALDITYAHTPPGSAAFPGSSITGTVKFTSKKDEAISLITITFSGRCKVKIRDHTHYTTRTFRSRGYYFYTTLQLFDGQGYTHKAGEYSWPFSFAVPRYAEHQLAVEVPAPGRPRRELDFQGFMREVNHAEMARGGRDYFPARQPWRASRDLREHELPDSCSVSNSQRAIDFEARVEYALIAKLVRPGGGGSKFLGVGVGRSGDLVTVMDVEMRSKFDEAERRLLKRRQVLKFERSVDMDSSGKGKGVVGKVLSRVKTGDTSGPKQVFQFTVEMAEAVCARTTVPFIVKVATKPFEKPPSYEDESAGGDANTVSIVDLNVQLIGRTSARDDGRAAIDHSSAKMEREVLCWRRDQNNIDIVMEREKDADSGGMMLKGMADLEDLIHVPALTPSFSTYNIAREYFLEFELKINACGETVTLENSSGVVKVVVLPANLGVGRSNTDEAPAYEDGVGEAAESSNRRRNRTSSKEAEAAAEREAAQRQEEASGDQLPAYEP